MKTGHSFRFLLYPFGLKSLNVQDKTARDPCEILLLITYLEIKTWIEHNTSRSLLSLCGGFEVGFDSFTNNGEQPLAQGSN